MINTRKFLPILLLVFLTPYAYSNQNLVCEKTILGVPKRDSFYLSGCDCSKDLREKHTVLEPEGIMLVGVCNAKMYSQEHIDWFVSKYPNQEPSRYESGRFFFKGGLIRKGVIKHNEYASGVNYYFISSRPGSLNQFAYAFYTMKFLDEKLAFSKFKPPSLKSEGSTGCWEANVTLRVEEMMYIEGDTDEAGSWLLQYSPLEITPFKSCPPEA